jgi:uncharacterized membrane protein
VACLRNRGLLGSGKTWGTMAGIGFVLRKLVRRDTLSGMAQAYFHGALASSGPWLLTILAISSIYLLTRNAIQSEAMAQFRTVILYNFCFGLVLSSPLTAVATRRLSDAIYVKDLRDAAGLLLGTLGFIFALLFPLATLFYFAIAELPVAVSSQAIANFLLICALWVVMVYVSALKFYLAITYSFLAGLAISVLGAWVFSLSGSAGMLCGFNLGLAVIIASLLALILVEYPRECQNPLAVVRCLKTSATAALGALLYNAGAWVDKWVMWFSPEAQTFGTGLPNTPVYDSSMFLAYLTIIPAMSLFIVSQETAFFDTYLKFYRAIKHNENFKTLETNHRLLIRMLVGTGRDLLLLQLFVCAVTLFAAPKIFESLGFNFIGLGIFRIGVLGATFQVFTLLITIFLSYFDARRAILAINALFFATNLLVSWVSLKAGFAFYGYGYFLSTVITFVFAAIVIERYLQQLPYHTFVDNNRAVIQ